MCQSVNNYKVLCLYDFFLLVLHSTLLLFNQYIKIAVMTDTILCYFFN